MSIVNLLKMENIAPKTLLMLVYICCVLSVEYTFNTRKDILELDSTVQSISMPSDDRIAIIKGDNQTNSIIITGFYGTKYQPAYFKNLVSPLLTASTYAYSNQGTTLRQLDLLGNRITSYNLSKMGNSNIVGSSDMMVVSIRDACPTIMLLNTTSNKTQLKVYEQGSQCRFNNSGYIQLIRNDTYIYAIGNYFYVLDTNYSMKTRVVQQMRDNQSYSSINVFVDSKNDNMSTLALVSNQNYVYIFSEGNQFQLSSKIYSPTHSFTLTSDTTANSFYKNMIYRWRELKSPLIYMNRGTFCIPFTPITLLNNQTYMVGGQKSEKSQQYRINFGIIQTNNLISVKQYISLDIKYEAIAHSGTPTSNNSIIFIQLQSNQTKSKSICKVSMSDKKTQIIKDRSDESKDGNCPAYGLISDSRIVTVCANVNNYEMQLRNTNDLSIISYVILDSIQTISDVKILTNQNWKGSIAVLTKKYNPSISDDCITKIYSTTNDQILATQYQSYSISFTRSWASGQYIVTMKLSGFGMQDNDVFGIYSAYDLSQVKSIPYNRASQSQQLYDILVHKHIVVVNSNIPPYDTQVYDLSKDMDSWLISTFFKDSKPKYGYGYFIFPTNNTLYQFSSCSGKQAKGAAAVGIYNLAVDQISQKQSMGTMFNFNSLYPIKYLYLTPEMAEDTCPHIIFASGITMYKFRDCQPYSAAQSFTLTKLSQPQPYTEFQYFIQTINQLYLLISYFSPSNNVYKAEVRAVKNIDIVIWYQESSVKINTLRYYVNSIAYTTNYSLKIYRVVPGQLSSDYSVSAFTQVDANMKRCVTFAGILTVQSNITRVFFKKTLYDISDQSIDVNSATLLSIDQNCKHIAYYDNNKVIVLEIGESGLAQIQQQVIEQVTSLKIRNRKLVMRRKKEFMTRYINGSHSNQEAIYQLRDKEAAVDSQNFQYSPDGSLAVRHDKSIFQVISTNGSKVVDTYNLTAERNYDNYYQAVVTGVGFSETNKLYMSNYNQHRHLMNLFIFYPKSCNPTQIKVNLHCTCDLGFKPKDQGCVCVSGYADQGQCLACSFPCLECYGPGVKCHTYSPWFYVMIGIPSIILLAIIVFGVFKCRQRKINREKSPLQEEGLERENTLMTSNNEI